MKSLRLLLPLLAILAFVACGDQVEYDQVATESQPAAEHPTGGDHPAPASQSAPTAPDGAWKAEILETMNSGGYTYVRVEKDGKEVWAAGPESAGLAAGDVVVLGQGMLMQNFHAKSLDRDFAEIYFVSALEKDDHSHGGAEHPMGAEPPMGSDGAVGRTILEEAGVEAVAKAEGGYTVAEIHEQAAALAGQRVKVRGQVVKFTPNIMRTNWVHLQDGSGSGETADLTITTSGRVAVGDIVVLEGPLSVNKDFGAGYKYGVIIESADVIAQ